jgi:hypothetical protein
MPTPKILPLRSLPGFRPLYQRAVEGFTYALGADDCPTLVKLKIYGASPVNLAVRAYRLAARLAELYSYSALIAEVRDGAAILYPKRHSVTTSKHQTWAGGAAHYSFGPYKVVSPEEQK